MRKTIGFVGLFIIIVLAAPSAFAADISGEDYLDWIQERADEGFVSLQQGQAEAQADAQTSIDASIADPFDFTPLRTVLMILPIGLTALFFILRKVLAKDSDVIETVEFYPPEDLNPSQLGFIYHGLVNRKGIASMAVYFADKGYLTIDYANETYTLQKTHEYDGANPQEAAFLRRLFSTADQVTEAEFYQKFSGLKSLMWELSNPFTIFVPLPNVWRILMACIGFAFVTPLYFRIIEAARYWGQAQVIVSIFFAVSTVGTIAFALWLGFRIGDIRAERKTPWENRDYLRAALLFCMGFVLINLMLLIGYHPWRFVLFTAIYWTCFALMAMLLLSIRKRTEYGNVLLGRIRGFKRFLETAEKEQLEALFIDNREYYYDILPYTYVLGISNTWIDERAGSR